MNGRIFRWVCLGLVSAAGFGCGGSEGTVNEDPDTLNFVRGGTVSVSGKEIPGGTIVTFHPKDGPVAGQQIIGQYADDENYYSVTTIKGTEKLQGAPEGEYVVTFQPPKNKPGTIPAKYADPATSGVTVEVKAGTNVYPETQLTP